LGVRAGQNFSSHSVHCVWHEIIWFALQEINSDIAVVFVSLLPKIFSDYQVMGLEIQPKIIAMLD
jgi:hypothetical protein